MYDKRNFRIVFVLLLFLIIFGLPVSAGGVDNASTVSLLHLNRSSGATLYDEAWGATWVRSGVTSDINTTQVKFGNASAFLFPSGFIYSSTGQVLNRQQFTVDWWMYMTSPITTGGNAIFSSSAGASAGYIYPSGTTLQYIKPGNVNSCTWAGVTSVAWHHLALQTNGTYASCYIDGVLSSTNAYTGFAFTDPTFYLGGYNGAGYLRGYLDEVRFSNVAIYGKSSYYTVPTGEYGATSGDTTPPDSITGLTNTSTACNSITWGWTNPTQSDFNWTVVWRDNVPYYNYTNASTSATWGSLTEGTRYNFSAKTEDLSRNLNATFVNLSVTTPYCAAVTPTPTPGVCDLTSIPWCGKQDLFYWNETSDVSGYQVLHNYPQLSNEAYNYTSVSSATGQKTVARYMSPNFTAPVIIAPGFWVFYSYFNVSSAVGTTQFEFKVFNRSPDGTMTNLFYGHAITDDVNSLTQELHLHTYARRNWTYLNAGDRLVIEVNASSTSVVARNAWISIAGNLHASSVEVGQFLCCDGSAAASTTAIPVWTIPNLPAVQDGTWGLPGWVMRNAWWLILLIGAYLILKRK